MQTCMTAHAGSIAKAMPPVNVLVVSSFPRDHSQLRSILPAPAWHVDCVSCGRDALRYLWRNQVALLICDETLPDGTWPELLEEASSMEPRPAFIIAGEAAGGWSGCGPNAAGWIAKPYRREQVLAAAMARVGSEVYGWPVCG